MADNKKSFVFYRSFYEAIKTMPENDKLQIYDAICEYALNGESTDLSGIQQTVFTLIKPQLEANTKRYENGLKGGRPKTKIKPKHNQNITSSKPNVNVNDNDNVNVNDTLVCSPEQTAEKLFTSFWNAYPKKQNKAASEKAFIKLKPDDELLNIMLMALENQKHSNDWQKENGRYIPLPSTWLNGRRWEDETNSQANQNMKLKSNYTPEQLKHIEELRNQ